MTVGELLELCDELAPNQFSWNDKVLWLSEIEGRIWEELREGIAGSQPLPPASPVPLPLAGSALPGGGITGDALDGSEGVDTQSFTGFNWRATNATQRAEVQGLELLLPEPWAREIYLGYLQASMDFYNREWEGFRLHRAIYESLLREYFGKTKKANYSAPRRQRWKF